MTGQRAVFEPVGWAMLRAPLLPVADDGSPLAPPDVRLALEIASEALAGELERSTTSPASRRTDRSRQRLDRALSSYLGRMRFRATPFGLCAGVSLITWGLQTDVSVTGALSPRARADMGWIGEIIRRIPRRRGGSRGPASGGLGRQHPLQHAAGLQHRRDDRHHRPRWLNRPCVGARPTDPAGCHALPCPAASEEGQALHRERIGPPASPPQGIRSGGRGSPTGTVTKRAWR